MKNVQYLKEEHKKDINIEITSLNNVLEKIKAETLNKQNIEVLLYSGYYKAKELIDYINSIWNKDFYNYLTINNIKIADVVCITPKDEIIFEKTKVLVRA